MPVAAEYIKKFSGLIITSKFAADSMEKAPYYSMPVWVVGNASAEIMAGKGYKIMDCCPNVRALLHSLPPSLYEKILYLSGDYITTEMPKGITRKILYQVSYRDSLSKQQVSRYKKGIDYIVLYSENCAKTLLRLLIEYNLVNSLVNANIIVISSKVKDALNNNFKNIIVAQGAESMLRFIK
jgi:uroporphyrinogen-III synthase